MSIIEINDLNKIYDGSIKKHALKDVDLNVKKGSFFGLLGPNGAGKSTLLNIIGGLTKKTTGSIKICGHDIDKEPNLIKAKIGMVPQEIIIDSFFTVRESVEVYASYFGIKKNSQKIAELINAVGLTEQMNTNTKKLSGGMKRRLLLAKALVNDPEILFLDEPTAGVDIGLRNLLLDYLHRLNKKGMTIILTTHYLEEAEKLCSDIAIINNGSIIVEETKQKIFSRYSDNFLIAEFNNEHIAKELAAKHPFAELQEHHKLCLTYSGQKELVNIIDFIHNYKSSITSLNTQQPKLEDILLDIIAKN